MDDTMPMLIEHVFLFLKARCLVLNMSVELCNWILDLVGVGAY